MQENKNIGWILQNHEAYDIIIFVAACDEENPRIDLLRKFHMSNERNSFDTLLRISHIKAHLSNPYGNQIPCIISMEGDICRGSLELAAGICLGMKTAIYAQKRIPCEYTKYDKSYIESIFTKEEVDFLDQKRLSIINQLSD